ncbi:MAG: SUMF1/EgtB/PvdO family nonheme iron enzyme [Polyangiaceae bacterium]|nr:SUMF1/EgtB/PvdO family nonheme iron enzyme [Polyangiaceae bacterium]
MGTKTGGWAMLGVLAALAVGGCAADTSGQAPGQALAAERPDAPAEASGSAASSGTNVPAALALGGSATPGASASAPPGLASASASASAPPAPPALVDGCPPEMTRIAKYCVDRWEAHLVTRAPDGGVVPHPHNHRPDQGVRYEARSEAGVFPQAYISRVESEAACKNAGKRLCTFPEWRRACQGTRWGRYPYGGRARSTICNSGKDHLLTRFFGPNANHWKYEENFNAPELDVEPGFLARTGEHQGCVSTEGAYDLVGNLHEWVSGIVDDRFMEILERDDVERKKQHWNTGNGIFMGGFFSTTDQLGPGCLYTTVAHEPRYHDYSTGFRCCAKAVVDEPPKPPPAAKKPPGKPKPKPKPQPTAAASVPASPGKP